MSDDSDGDDIAAAQVLQKALLQRVPPQKRNIKSIETHFGRKKI